MFIDRIIKAKFNIRFLLLIIKAKMMKVLEGTVKEAPCYKKLIIPKADINLTSNVYGNVNNIVTDYVTGSSKLFSLRK